MSDTSQGPGWWRASNGLWYPPEAKPGPRSPRSGGSSRSDGSGTSEPDRRPPGVPDRPPADPKVQQPFTPRPFEPLELERDRERRHRRDRRDPLDDPPARRSVPWGWIGVVVLVLIFGGIGTWLAVTAERGGDVASDDPGDGEAGAETSSTTVASSSSTSTSSSSTSTTTSDVVSVFDLAAGDCFSPPGDDAADGEELVLTSVQLVDCADPHLAEVIEVSRFRDDPGEPFPGEESRDTDALGICQPIFEEYVGVSLAASDLGLIWLAPTRQTWEEDDDREVTCAVQSLDGAPLVGSVAGSGL